MASVTPTTPYFPHGIPSASERLVRTHDDKNHYALTDDGAALLLEMAINDMYPDGTFGDFECTTWETFRQILRLYKCID